MSLAQIIHERFMGLCSAHRKTDEYAANVAEVLRRTKVPHKTLSLAVLVRIQAAFLTAG